MIASVEFRVKLRNVTCSYSAAFATRRVLYRDSEMRKPASRTSAS